jgi:hypothetical protein
MINMIRKNDVYLLLVISNVLMLINVKVTTLICILEIATVVLCITAMIRNIIRERKRS